jgi:3-oxoadipate enol-lactonase
MSRLSIALFLLFAVSLRGTALSARAAEGNTTSDKQESFVNVEGGTLFYQECGSGPFAVILIHDGIADSAVWDEVWPEFCKHFHTVR